MDIAKLKGVLKKYPENLIEAIVKVAQQQEVPIYLVGGTLRDLQLGNIPKDVDFTVPQDGTRFCRLLIKEMKAGTFVSLAGRSDEDAGRVVWKGLTIDISSFRDGTKTLEDDLCKRDFTINSMAVDFQELVQKKTVALIDPTGGAKDLTDKVLRSCENSFVDDPLRMLRGHRFQATHDFKMDRVTIDQLVQHKGLIHNVSKERVQYELGLVIGSKHTHREFAQMAGNGLLFEIMPELKLGVGVEQPDFHHLDVFHHALEALRCMEVNLAAIRNCFSAFQPEIEMFVRDENVVRQLKWAALFHDLGKPSVMKVGSSPEDRPTFHNHDKVGKKIFQEIATRLRWSKDDITTVGNLIFLHMHPFHLSNLYREGSLSKRAVARLARRADNQLIGLFLLAMADSMSSQGRLKPEKMEDEIDGLFQEVYSTYIDSIQPVFDGPKHLDGKDLIKIYGLTPGPLFKEILSELELATIEGVVVSREDAFSWVEKYLNQES